MSRFGQHWALNTFVIQTFQLAVVVYGYTYREIEMFTAGEDPGILGGGLSVIEKSFSGVNHQRQHPFNKSCVCAHPPDPVFAALLTSPVYVSTLQAQCSLLY